MHQLFLAFQELVIHNAEGLDIVMPMYNLFEYNENYADTTGSSWNYCRDEPNIGVGGADNDINYSIKVSRCFDHETSITGKLEGNNAKKEDVKIVVSLKHLSNFWRTLERALINGEINLILTWSGNCMLTARAHKEKFVATGTDQILNLGKLIIQEKQQFK